MSKKPLLTDSQKETIATSFLHGATQTDLAELYGVSRRSIQRALQEKSMLPPDGLHDDLVRRKPVMTQEQKHMLAVLESRGVNATRLTQILNAPALIPENIVKYMARLSDADTVTLLQAVREERKGLVQDVHAA